MKTIKRDLAVQNRKCPILPRCTASNPACCSGIFRCEWNGKYIVSSYNISSHNHISSYIIVHNHISSYITVHHHISYIIYLCIISHHGRKHLQTLCSKLEALISLPRFERALNHSTVWSHTGSSKRPVLASGDDHRISPDGIYMRHHEASTVNLQYRHPMTFLRLHIRQRTPTFTLRSLES